VLGLADVEAVLHAEKDEAARAWLMHLMERCGIACALPAAPGGGAWLVPRALPAAAPAGSGGFLDAPDAVRIRYIYQTMPDDPVARLIVRRHAFVEELREQKQQWRGGVVFTRKGARALIRADSPNRQLLLTVTGPRNAREQFAGLCQQEIRDIHAEIPCFDPVEEIHLRGEWVATAANDPDTLKDPP